MTRKQAEDIVIEIRREAEEAFRKSGLSQDSRLGFMLGFVQSAFVEALLKENKPVKLIAAAPDMLKALMSVQKYLYYKEENEGRGLGDFVHPKHAIQNAIDKATK